MLKIAAEINQEDIKNLLENFSGKLVRNAVRSALDRTGTWGKNYLAQDVSGSYNLSPSRVKQAITVQRTTQSSLEVSLRISGERLSVLDDFHAIQDRVGIKANIARTQTFSVSHAFINVARNSAKRVVMLRTGRMRYPTTGKPGRGPSIPILVDRLANRERRDADLKDHLYQELSDQIARRTGGLPQLAGLE